MSKKLTQKKTAFYILWKLHKEKPEMYLPAYAFVGEFYVREIERESDLEKWFFMSYKGPTNGLEIFHENPGLVERRMTTGKTGAQYYEYRLALAPTMDMILDKDLRVFAEEVEAGYKKSL